MNDPVLHFILEIILGYALSFTVIRHFNKKIEQKKAECYRASQLLNEDERSKESIVWALYQSYRDILSQKYYSCLSILIGATIVILFVDIFGSSLRIFCASAGLVVTLELFSKNKNIGDF